MGTFQSCMSVPNKKAEVDWVALRKDISELLTSNKTYDEYGNYGPLLVRLAWHSSGTYDAATKTGGSGNGATMRFSPESDDPENAGLDIGRDLLEGIKKKHPGISYADLWIYASYVFIEESGGPKIDFTPGRVDKTAKDCVENGRLPQAEFGVEGLDPSKVDEEGRICGWEKTSQHVKDVFHRMGITSQEATALLCGGHVYGRCHPERSGYNGPWVEEPDKFSNEYAADMIEDDWALVGHHSKVGGCPVRHELKPAEGHLQYIGIQEMPEEAPDATAYPPGMYEVTTTWVNVRESTDTKSKILGRPETGAQIMCKEVKIFGTAVRGHLDTGGWVSIVGSAGKELFKRVGEFEDRTNPEKEPWRTGEEFEDEPPPPQMMLITDMVLLWDPEFYPHLKKYADDEDALIEDFGKAYKKLTELGFKEFPEPVSQANVASGGTTMDG